jgi:ribonuclease P protein component
VSSPRPKLPRKARLSGGAQFTGAFSVKRYGRYFVVLARPNDSGETSRLGVVAGRRAVPRAVARSLMKRLIREVFRRHRHLLDKMDFVIRVRQPAAPAVVGQARAELERLLLQDS